MSAVKVVFLLIFTLASLLAFNCVTNTENVTNVYPKVLTPSTGDNLEEILSDKFFHKFTELGSLNRVSIPFTNNFATLTGHGWRVREVAFSPAAPILATGSSDGSIRLWNLTNGEILHILSRHHYGIISLDFSPSGEILASGGYDNRINLWNVSSGEPLKAWSFYPHAVIDLKWSPDGKTLAVGGGEWMGVNPNWNQPEKYLRLLNATNGDVIKQFSGHTDTVFSISFSKNGSLLISGSWDKSIRLWNVSSGLEIRSFTGHSDKITSIVFSHDESTIISGSLDQTLKFWDVNAGTLSQEIMINESIWSIALSPIDATLAVAVDPSIVWPDRYWLTFGKLHDCTIQLWNITAGSIIDTLVGHMNSIESVKFSNDGTILASASWDWTVKLWGDYPSLQIAKPVDEWPTSSPEEQGVNSTLLADNLKIIESTKIHSVLIIRHGKLIFEQYYYDSYSQNYTRYLKHTHFSATKSFTSALIGIAIDKGFIDNTEQLVIDFFPEKTIGNIDARKEAITLYHLLTMTSGIEYDEYDDIWGMGIANDSVEYVLSKPVSFDPGSRYKYNTGSSQLLSAIIQKTTGYSTRDFAMKYLFGPLGIEELDVTWVGGADGVYCGGIGLFMTPRNMAKFGQLYLNNGSWNEQQIIPSNWIKLSSQDHVEGIPKLGLSPPGYGYHFWVDKSANKYYALGGGGQTIQILPEHDMIIVTTARVTDAYQEEYMALSIPSKVINSFLPESTITSTTPQPVSWSMVPAVTFFTVVVLIHRRKKIKCSKR